MRVLLALVTLTVGSANCQSSISQTSSSPSSASSLASSVVSASISATPSHPAKLSPEWQAAYEKAVPQVSKLSVQDKVDLATGIGWQAGPCLGNISPVKSINFPGLCLQDSPLGVRLADLVSAFPAGINAASTWSRDLIRKRGEAMGAEFKAKGANVVLGPMMNLARVAAGGRNWEGFGADPWLAGEAAYETIIGLQSAGVQATAKHYVANEQEHFRESSSSNLDDRTLMEAYAYPFLRSVQANVASVMCSYNQLNSTYACENDYILNHVLKEEFGFPGFIMSDWWATHSTEPAVNGGLDMTMPGNKAYGVGGTWFGPNLVAAVNNGTVSQERLTDLASRILAAWYLLGQDHDYPVTNFDSWNVNKSQHINVQGDHKSLIREIGFASTVLLKNDNGVLPLKNPSSLGVIGSGARNTTSGDPNQYPDRGGNDGVLAMGWGSGTAEFPYLISPAQALIAQAAKDGTIVVTSFSDTDPNATAEAATGREAALVFITSDSGEGFISVEGNDGDRNDLLAWHSGDALVRQVAQSNNNTIVVVNSVGPIIVEPWIDHENVTAVVWSGLPGQEAGNGLVDILYGAYNPSARLPYTIARSEDDYPAKVLYEGTGVPQIPYSEGIFIDYRHFDANNIEPRFEFGFGLSYTTFQYSDISVKGTPSGGRQFSSTDDQLFKKVVKVSFKVSNTGYVDGNEVPQVYITLPDSAQSAPFNLKGFDKVHISSGSSADVTIQLSNHDFSVWDTVSQTWLVPSGSATISVGASSRNLKLTKNISY